MLAIATSKSVSNLVALNLHGTNITDKSIVALANSANCRYLKELNLQSCLGITDEGMLAVASSKSVSNLVALNLHGTNITDKSIVALANSANCRYLKELNLQSCSGITDEGMLAVASSKSLSNVVALNLYGTNVTKACPVILSECINLKNIDLSWCQCFTDAGVLALAHSANLSSLTTLNLWNTKITDKSLVALAESAYCKTLKDLNLGYCSNFTDAGVLALAHSANLSSLTTLNLWNTKITDTAKDALRNQLKSLNIIG